MAGWVISNVFLVQRYLGKYNRSEIGTFRVGRVWWVVDACSIFDLNCCKKTSGEIITGCCRSCAQDPSDKGTLHHNSVN